MPTSGVTDFSLTARDIVTDAMIEARIVGVGRVPRAAEMTKGILEMNKMLKYWQSKDVSLWRETNGTVTVVANEQSGALPAYVRDVITANVFAGGVERPLTLMTRGEYNTLPNKAQSGNPSLYYVARQRDAVVMYVWPVPTVDTSVKVSYDRIVDTVTNPDETVDMPQEYHDTLISCLALKLCKAFADQPTQHLATHATMLEQAMFDADRPESYMMGAYA